MLGRISFVGVLTIMALLCFLVGCASETEKTYQLARKAADQKEWAMVRDELPKIKEYKDSEERLKEANFYYYMGLADASLKKQDYIDALIQYTKATIGFNDSLVESKISACYLEQGDRATEKNDHMSALVYYKLAREREKYRNGDLEQKIVLAEQGAKTQKEANERKAAILKKQIDIRHDDVKDITWFSSRKNLLSSGVFAYFGQFRSGKGPLRLNIVYYGDRWIFWDNITFNIDGEITTLPFEPKRDHSSSVWEEADVEMTSQYLAIVESITKSKITKIRFSGQSSADKIITDAQKQDMQKVLDLYSLIPTK